MGVSKNTPEEKSIIMDFWGFVDYTKSSDLLCRSRHLATKLNTTRLCYTSHSKSNLGLYCSPGHFRLGQDPGYFIVGDIDDIDIAGGLINCKDFCQQYSGSYFYVYYKHSPYGLEELQVLRGWDNKKSLFYFVSTTGTIYFSNSLKILSSLGISIGLNNSYFNFFLQSQIPNHYTGFTGIHELLAGCCIKIDLNLLKQPITQTLCLDFHTNKYPSQTATDLFKNEIPKTLQEACTSATKNFQNIILDYSGGLDSTFLLYNLKEMSKSTGQHIIPINFYSNYSSLANEQAYCKIFCEKMNIKLTSFDHDQCLPFDDLHKFDLSPIRPSPELALYKRFQIIELFANSLGKYCFVNGEGGDHLFSCPPIPESLLDIISDRNIYLLLRVLKELYYIFRFPIFQILKIVLLAIINQSSLAKEFIQGEGGLPQEFLQTAELPYYLDHPYFTDYTPSLRIGKALQIMNIKIGRLISNIDPRSNNLLSDTTIIHPLLCQSFLAEALRMPTYHNFSYGYDRYLVRQFLSEKLTDIPEAWRKDKGDIAGLVQKGFQRNVNSIKELCIEGYLVREGITKKSNIENKIGQLLTGGLYEDYHIFLNMVGIELMAQSWKNNLYR